MFTNTGIDRDFVIPGLQTAFESPTLELSQLVWNTVSNRSQDKRILKATYRNNQSNSPHYAESQLVHQLRAATWIPQGEDTFVQPPEALRDLLPDGFPFDPGWAWLDAIGFGTKTRQHAEQLHKNSKIATQLGFRDETALDDGIRFSKLDPEDRKRILSEYQTPIALPAHEPGNRERRAKKVRKNARKAPERKTEMRPRFVSVNRDATKRQRTDPYLRELYTNDDGITICQICRDRLPFRLADGSYFFEAVEFLKDLEKHHYQNYLALCPNHAAMFMHANDSRYEMRDRFLTLETSELQMILAGQPVTVYFTDTHVADLRAVIEVDNED